MSRIPRVLVLSLVSSCLLSVAVGPVVADDVYLTNGRVFEDVVAWEEGDRVAVRLPHGLIRLPVNRVARIVPGDTVLATYLERKAALEARAADAESLARGYVELAAWARDRDLASAYREAARIAADLDPRAPGLEPLMRDLGLLYDDRGDRWMTEDELMRKRGFVQYDGAWVTPTERAEAVARITEARAKQEAARQEAREGEVLAALAGALRAEAEAEALREARRVHTVYSTPVVYYVPGIWTGFPGHVQPAPQPGDGGGDAGPPAAPQPPASRTRPAHRGTFRASDWIPGKLNPRAAPPPGTLTGSTARTSGARTSGARTGNQ